MKSSSLKPAFIGRLSRNGGFTIVRSTAPITFPGSGHIIVTDEMKQEMENAGFRGITFRLVEKTHIAKVPWHEWDLTASEPKYYPEGGEPEGYILNEPHSAELAASLGPIWEVVLTDSAEVIRHTDPTSHETTFAYVEGSWNGNDLFSVSENFVQISRLLFGATSILAVVVKMLKSSIPALSSSFEIYL